MPSTASIVLFRKNSGVISTRPPIAITSRMPTIRMIEFFSKIWCRCQKDMLYCSSYRRLKSERRLDFRLADPHGHPEIVGHDQRADQEERAAKGTNDVEGMHRLDGLDEGIFKEAERGVGAPHQALEDAGHPHRRDVEDDAEGRDPEVPIDELEAVEAFAIPGPRHQ